MSENELRNAFAQLTAGVKPAASAYQRLMRRKEREHRIRTTSWATAAIGAGLSLVMLPLTLAGGLAGPSPSPSQLTFPSPSASNANVGELTPWVSRLIDSPVRGNLADNSSFLTELQQRVAAQDWYPLRSGNLKPLFAGDIGDFRIAIFARYTGQSQIGIFVAGSRGASAEALMNINPDRPDRGLVGYEPLKPYYGQGFRKLAKGSLVFASVGLAPSGCGISTTGSDFGDFVVMTDSPVNREARVSCDGVVRYDGAFSDSVIPVGWGPPLEAEIDAAYAGLVGEIPRDSARQLLSTCDPGGDVRLRYGGPVPQGSGTIYIGTCRDLDGLLMIRTRYPVGGSNWSEEPHYVEGPAEILAIRIDGRIVIVAPASAAKAEFVDSAGATLAQTTLENGIGSIPDQPQGTVRVTDADGKEMGRAQIASTRPLPQFPYPSTVKPRVESW